MDQFDVGSIVWASARGDIFWPGKVVDLNKDTMASSKQVNGVTVNFFIEDSYELIRTANKMLPWNCEKQQRFIEKGRALKNLERKVEFNKALAKADMLFSLQRKENEKGSPKKIRRRGSLKKKEKLNTTGKSEIHFRRRSPRQLRTNGDSQGYLVLSDANGLKEPRSKDTNDCISTLGNVGQVKCLPAAFDEAGTNKNGDVTTEGPHSKRQRTECGERMIKSELTKCVGKRKTASDSVLHVSASTGTGKKRDRRKSHPVPAKTAMSSQRQCVQSNVLSPGHCDSKTSSQRKCTSKRKLLQEGTVSYKKSTASKEAKRCEQNNYGNSTGTVLIKNSTDAKELHEGVSCDKSTVDSCQETVTESGDSSDNELFLEPFLPNHQDKKFSIGDIVWAKFNREPYWPAVIKKVTGKRKTDTKFLVKFLAWNDCLFKIQPSKLVHFACNESQRSEFMGVKMYTEELQGMFQEALFQAEDFLNRKGLGKGLDDDEIDEEQCRIFEEEVLDSENDGKESDVSQTATLPQTPSTSLSECRKSLRARKPVSKYSNIVSYIRQSKPMLKEILNGSKPSERHQIYTSGRVSEKDNLKRRSGFGPIADGNVRDEVMNMLNDYYQELRGTSGVSYVADVWLPEAIIWSISEIDHVDHQRAEKIFQEGFEHAVTNDEVLQLTTKLKQRKPSAETREERLKCAERALKRHFAES
ncbi:PWWP domain-containing DNA repair factor 3A-like isoform X1 [Montipora capricornis]|uniref:PWWP domain-containing DNA repair factor 3A-like isoform X1 n=1 Tax=Montipora capricornis TaxID=246305 RepID=UPI0035F1A581